LTVTSFCLLMGAECQMPGSISDPIAAGTYRGTIGGESQLSELNGTVIEISPVQSTLTVVFDAQNRPISLNTAAAGGVPSQTLTVFNVTQTQRFQYSYNDPANGSVSVDYTVRVIRSEGSGGTYTVEYDFNGTQTTIFGVTTMFGTNKYTFYNQSTGVWVVHDQVSTLTPPGGQGSLKSSLFQTGLLLKTN
ncbi:MAG TPA: hypothetical protein PLS23_23155, partial [Phycisphaerae bacterium]|nr:hypothetical protein [Phycisphaerae bacterium]